MHYIFIGLTAFLLAVATMVLAVWLIIGEVGYAVVDMSQSKWPRLADKSITTHVLIPLFKIHVLRDEEEKVRFEAVPENEYVTLGINIKPNTTAAGTPENAPILPRGRHENLLDSE
jgi:hypothetical protein